MEKIPVPKRYIPGKTDTGDTGVTPTERKGEMSQVSHPDLYKIHNYL